MEFDVQKMEQEIEWKVKLKRDLVQKDLNKNRISPRTFDYKTKLIEKWETKRKQDIEQKKKTFNSIYQNLNQQQKEFDLLKKKIHRKDPFVSGNSFSNLDVSSSALVDETLETPGRDSLDQTPRERSFNSGNRKCVKAIPDKHIHGVVPFEYRPGQSKKPKSEIEMITNTIEQMKANE